ncbi:MAG: hypothetical protein JSS36_06390 [Proteobacteria bacterium]|nr:hypothetical protein [Pseudomonadota bacterium]
MTNKTDKPATASEGSGWGGAAAIAGAAIGSAALAAALLYASRRKPKGQPAPARPEDAPETD